MLENQRPKKTLQTLKIHLPECWIDSKRSTFNWSPWVNWSESRTQSKQTLYTSWETWSWERESLELISPDYLSLTAPPPTWAVIRASWSPAWQGVSAAVISYWGTRGSKSRTWSAPRKSSHWSFNLRKKSWTSKDNTRKGWLINSKPAAVSSPLDRLNCFRFRWTQIVCRWTRTQCWHLTLALMRTLLHLLRGTTRRSKMTRWCQLYMIAVTRWGACSSSHSLGWLLWKDMTKV